MPIEMSTHIHTHLKNWPNLVCTLLFTHFNFQTSIPNHTHLLTDSPIHIRVHQTHSDSHTEICHPHIFLTCSHPPNLEEKNEIKKNLPKPPYDAYFKPTLPLYSTRSSGPDPE